MSVRNLLVAVLLFSVCLFVQSSVGNRRHPTPGVVPLCCTKVSSVDISAQTTGKYSIQKAKGPCVYAMIFHTKNGKVCVDPTAEWTQRFTARNQG